MANTYTQIRIHIIFSTKNREPLIAEAHREEVERYMTGIVTSLNQKLLAIYCMPDHAHLLIGIKPDISISELVQKLKVNSSKFINQKGFGAFSYAKSQTKQVIDYILNQEEHHKKKTFEEEYLDFLEKFEVDYDPKYVLG